MWVLTDFQHVWLRENHLLSPKRPSATISEAEFNVNSLQINNLVLFMSSGEEHRHFNAKVEDK